MNTITDTAAPHAADVTPAATDEDRPVLLFVDPSTVKVEVNVRKTPSVSREFVASVKRHGVLVPMLGYLDADGDPVIRDGQRRILAAQKAGRNDAPVLVYPNRDALLSAGEAERARIIEQMNANAHRESLTESDALDGIQQLALTGLEPTVIAKELSVKADRVVAALAVAASDLARRVVDRHQVTLDQAAVLAEFDGDDDTVRTLIHYAENDPDRFAHQAQRHRDQRDQQRALQAEIDGYVERGIPVVEAPPRWDNRTGTAYLHELQRADGTAVTVENYADQPGFAICIIDDYGARRLGHVVTEWRSHGLRRTSQGGAVQGKLTETEKAARREVVTNNKEWDSAEKVRREWLTTLLSRKALPKDADQFVAYMVTERAHVFGKSLDDPRLAAALLGLGDERGSLGRHVTARPAKARQVTFALALAAGELALDRGSWRAPSDRDRAFLKWLLAWGYTASRVEELIITEPKKAAPRSSGRRPAPAETPVASDNAPSDQVA